MNLVRKKAKPKSHDKHAACVRVETSVQPIMKINIRIVQKVASVGRTCDEHEYVDVHGAPPERGDAPEHDGRQAGSRPRHGEPLERPPEVLEERDDEKDPADEHVVNFCFTVVLQDRAFPHREELL